MRNSNGPDATPRRRPGARGYQDLFHAPEFTPFFLTTTLSGLACTMSGHALGLHSSGMLACQGLGGLLAGGLAQQVTPAAAMALLAAASVALAPGLRPEGA
ncbi:hypothetical protein [Streptomyces koyangensis]|uniref:hypothetical protein n=1 Tax=Streptomyces koyangensis TaxID=188770 RepID=UPI003C2D4A0B